MDIILLFLILIILNQMVINGLTARFTFLSRKILLSLFYYHLFFLVVYYVYTLYNASDSILYYADAKLIGENWDIFRYTGTHFIENFSAIFVQVGLSYESMMLLYSWFGYLGFVYAYIYFKENITIDVKIFKKFDLMTVLLFLPNMHFWTVSLGKGSLIFMGLMMFAFAVKIPQKRILILLLGGFFVYMIRPPIMFFALVGVMVGILIGREKISAGQRILVVVAAIGFLFVASSTILKYANLEGSENYIEDFQNFSEVQSKRLKSGGSSVDMNNYSLPFKFFTFWFRPLFIDSPGILGLFSSAENLLYLLLFAKILNMRFVRFIRKAPYMVKMSAVTFLTTSFAMTFVMSNLGIMMRQKAQVMYFAFFVIYYFLANEKLQQMQKNKVQETT